ncbi:MAG: hypothetical protein ACRBF0_18025 [Calditrichia bacterium]
MKQLYIICMLVIGTCFLQAGDLTVEQIIKKNIEARGGEKNIEALKALEIEGDYNAFSLTNPFKMWKQRPGHYRFDCVMVGAKATFAFDGTRAWQIHPSYGSTDPMRLPNADSLIIERDAVFDPPVYEAKKNGYEIELKGTEDLDDGPAYHLAIMRPDSVVENWFVDAESFLEVKMAGGTYDFGRPVTKEAFYGEYKAVDGVMLPHFIEVEYGTRYRVFTIASIKATDSVPAETFAMPVVEKKEEAEGS